MARYKYHLSRPDLTIFPDCESLSPMYMRSTRPTIILIAVFISRTLGAHNCKCQDVDANGVPGTQYNDLTAACCKEQYDKTWSPIDDIKYPGPNHQCVSGLGEIDTGTWGPCCSGYGVGHYCWK